MTVAGVARGERVEVDGTGRHAATQVGNAPDQGEGRGIGPIEVLEFSLEQATQ